MGGSILCSVTEDPMSYALRKNLAGLSAVALIAACTPAPSPPASPGATISPSPAVASQFPGSVGPAHPTWPKPTPISAEVAVPVPGLVGPGGTTPPECVGRSLNDPILPDSCRAHLGLEPPLYSPPSDAPTVSGFGPFEIETYSPVTITGLEGLTHIYLTARNTGARSSDISSFFRFQDWSSGAVSEGAGATNWLVLHGVGFDSFEFDPFERRATTVPAGASFTFEYVVTKSLGDTRRAEVDLPILFQLTDGGEVKSITIHVVGLNTTPDALADIPPNASITGRITDPTGNPIADADVTVGLWNAENHVGVRTDAAGRYSVRVPSQGELKSVVGNRPLPYRSLAYFVTVEARGYELGYTQEVRATAGMTTTINFTLQRAATPSYRQVTEFKSDGRYAYWYMQLAGPDRDRVVASQGQHRPRAPGNPPGHLVALRLSDGQLLWRFDTPDECNNLDVSPDGTRIAIGCWDGYLYVLDADGKLLWKREMVAASFSSNGEAGDPRYSPDGRWLAGDRGLGADGPLFTLYNARRDTGAIEASAQEARSSRVVKFRWLPDSQSLYVIGNNDEVSRYDVSGHLLWTRWHGNAALWAEVDPDGNIYVAGKGVSLVSYDPDGNLRFYRMLAQTADDATHGISADGRLIITPTFNGLLQAFDAEGELYFQRWLPDAAVPPDSNQPPEGVGHNALDITPDAQYFLVGTRSYRLELFDAFGALLWSHQAIPRTDFQFPANQAANFFPGADSVVVSADAHYLVAGYADSVIRIFERE